MAILDWLLGHRLSTEEAEHQQIGPLAGVPVLGLDALSSAAYGPEAALTLLMPLGVAGLGFLGPISACIIAILLVVYVSYRQTIAAYPGGGGSYTVARENLGERWALVAGAALALDYVLNVAVGISAGVGALVSAVPSLLPHIRVLCLAILVLLTLVNLRGLRESGMAFLAPTWIFVGALLVVIGVGLVRTVLAGGHPAPVEAPPAIAAAAALPSAWLVLRAFASGCTAMTGVEAVSNGVPIFRAPAVPRAQRTLSIIIAILVALLAGIAVLVHAYGIAATPPGSDSYRSVLSMVVAAVMGRGAFYYVTMASIVAVLALSANTSFADFPRLCRVLADDRYLPGVFAVRGRRLVYSQGILLLSLLAGSLLWVYGGITDALIPLFAIGAFAAFTLSQAGMVEHWRRAGGPGSRRALILNAAGAIATGATTLLVAISKFVEGAWLIVVAVPALVLTFRAIHRHYRFIGMQIATIDPLVPQRPPVEAMAPLAVIAAGSWNRMVRGGLELAMRLAPEVHIVQVRTERDSIEDLYENYALLIKSPAHAAGVTPPSLVVLTSSYREFFKPFVDYVEGLALQHPGRDVLVVIPDLVLPHWYEGILHNNRGSILRALVRLRGIPRVAVVDVPYCLRA